MKELCLFDVVGSGYAKLLSGAWIMVSFTFYKSYYIYTKQPWFAAPPGCRMRVLGSNPGMAAGAFDAALAHPPSPAALEQEHQQLLKRWQRTSRHKRQWGEHGLRLLLAAWLCLWCAHSFLALFVFCRPHKSPCSKIDQKVAGSKLLCMKPLSELWSH